MIVTRYLQVSEKYFSLFQLVNKNAKYFTKCIFLKKNPYFISLRLLCEKAGDNDLKDSSKPISEQEMEIKNGSHKFGYDNNWTDHFSANVIYDFDEERHLKEKGLWRDEKKQKEKPKLEISEKRGKTGVFDPEELVDFLRSLKALNVVVIHVPPHFKFVDYLVIATGKTKKHISVLGELTYQAYKRKMDPTDDYIKVEGKAMQSTWLALDMENIALHIMAKEIREEKDIECLWTIGAEYDDHCQMGKQDSYIKNLVARHQQELVSSPPKM